MFCRTMTTAPAADLIRPTTALGERRQGSGEQHGNDEDASCFIHGVPDTILQVNGLRPTRLRATARQARPSRFALRRGRPVLRASRYGAAGPRVGETREPANREPANHDPRPRRRNVVVGSDGRNEYRTGRRRAHQDDPGRRSGSGVLRRETRRRSRPDPRRAAGPAEATSCGGGDSRLPRRRHSPRRPTPCRCGRTPHRSRFHRWKPPTRSCASLSAACRRTPSSPHGWLRIV